MAKKSPFIVKALTVVCTDAKRSARFYQTVLGATPLPTDVGGLPPWYQLGSLTFTLLPNAAEPSPAEFGTHAQPMLWLETADLAAALRRFAKHGVTVLDEGDSQFVVIADPDGLPIEVWQAEGEE